MEEGEKSVLPHLLSPVVVGRGNLEITEDAGLRKTSVMFELRKITNVEGT